MNRLVFAASERDADMLYAVGFLVPDAFLYFEKAGRSYAVLSPLEYDRGRKEAQVDVVINQSDLLAKLFPKGSPKKSSQWIAAILKKYGLRKVLVSPAFRVGLADALRKEKIRIEVADGELFPERQIKKKKELQHLRKALKVTAELLEHSIQLIRSSKKGKNGVLMLRGTPLTSERVQSEIRMEAARRGFEASHPIVAGGIQGCDPHERGHGKLRAHELIILDIFPRDLATGYWGDMTRTVVKGRASEAQRRQFHTVHKAQKLAFSKLRGGINGRSVHSAIEDFYEEQGYFTGNASGRYEGFFHGTGHGLGLEIHEPPRVSTASQILKAGEVVTVEPGLYYQKTGGVRIEDVVVLKSRGCEKLSNYPVFLEI
jgi:Xaa-Pro aminopeptidase